MRPIRYKAIYLLLTNTCNVNCSFCYRNNLFDRTKPKPNMSEQVLFDAYDYILDELPCEDELHIYFWGGEPLIKFNLIKSAVEKYPQFIYHTNSNGVLVNQEVFDFFKKHRYFKFIWSLGSAYEKYGSIKAMTEKLPVVTQMVKELNFGVNFTVTNLDSMYDDYVYIYNNITHNITVDILRNHKHTDEELDKFVDEYYKISIEYEQSDLVGDNCKFRDLVGYRVDKNLIKNSTLWYETYGPKSIIKRWSFCKCGLKRLAIDTEGKIWSCDGCYVAGINQWGDIYNGIDYSKLQYHQELDENNEKMSQYCEGCEIYGRCTRQKCLATNYQYNGDMLKPEENYCRINKALFKLIKRYIDNKERETECK